MCLMKSKNMVLNDVLEQDTHGSILALNKQLKQKLSEDCKASCSNERIAGSRSESRAFDCSNEHLVQSWALDS